MLEKLSVTAPFHLEATVRILQRRPANLIDTWDGRCYRRTVRIRGRPVLLQVINRGTVDLPDLRLSVLPAAIGRIERAEAARVAAGVLSLDVDTRAAQKHASAQPALQHTAIALRGMRPPRYPDL